MSWKKTDKLMDTIKHYSSFPATGVSLRQMVQFGERPSIGMLISNGAHCLCQDCAADPSMLTPGTLFRASQFLSEELPIRLAHRVQELSHLPDGLNEMPSIQKVQDWYAQSFEVSSKTRLAVQHGVEVLTCDGRKSPLYPNQSCPKRSGTV
jgi:pyruvate dehydrogenase kinase 2/3/4